MTKPASKGRKLAFWIAASVVVVALLNGWLRRDHADDDPVDISSATDPATYDSHGEKNTEMGNQPDYTRPASAPNAMTQRQGQCFRFAVPNGWQVVEDGQFAVVLMAPDQRAITTMVGNVGLPTNYNPAQYVSEKLAQAGLGNLRLGQGRSAAPVFGFPSAWEFDVDYMVGGIVCHGVAKCSVAPNYDFCTMVMTWAASEASQWANYASWLPQLAGQVEVTNSAAFGASGIAQQNLQNSIALGEQARRNREASERQWADVTRERGESQDRNNADFREALDGVKRYDNPYDNRPIDLPTTNTVYWINLTTGQIVGDANPTFDPRTATDSNWQPMKQAK